MNTPGKNIKTLRQQKGWSQSKAAEQLGISIPAFSKIETGITDMNISRAQQIADLFEVSIMTIITGNDDGQQFKEGEIQALKDQLMVKSAEIARLQQKLIDLYEEVRSQPV